MISSEPLSGSTADDEALIGAYIVAEAGGDGAEARIRHHGVWVWALVGHLRWRGYDVAATARDYGLPAAAVDAAIAYHRRHRAAIDDRLAQAGTLSG